MPAPARKHIEKRIAERSIPIRDVRELGAWLASKPLVPAGDWYKTFGSCTLVGRGPLPLSILDPDMKPYGEKTSSLMKKPIVRETVLDIRKRARKVAVAPPGGIYYHGGPDIPSNVLKNRSGAIFFTKSRSYAELYIKSRGALYETYLDFSAKKIFDPEDSNDLDQLQQGFLNLVGTEYNEEDDALSDYSQYAGQDLLDWSIGSQVMEAVEAAGFHGMRFRERPGSLARESDGSFSVSGEPIESVALFDKEIPVERVKTAAAQDVTDTPAFKAWFGNSVVKDAHGKPLRVYHGTTRDFSEFSRQGGLGGALGFWFATTPEAAEVFTRSNDEEARPQIMPVYLSIHKPKVYQGHAGLVEAARAQEGATLAQRLHKLKENLLRQRYDGIMIKNSTTDGGGLRDDYVAFQSNQIKSAIGNNGDFDREMPFIWASAKQPRPTQDTTQTPQFKAWFGASKIVGSDGKPLVVHHGTNADFDTFDRAKTKSGPSKFGFWFTSDKDFAELFGSKQMATYLKMERPYKITSSKWNHIRDLHAKDTEWFERWRDRLRGAGYDGLWVEGEQFISSKGIDLSDPSVFAVFEPNQIKSVENSGAFDPGNASITASANNLDMSKVADLTLLPPTQQLDEIFDTLVATQLDGFGGNCFVAAMAIRNIVLRGKGTIVVAMNRAFRKEGRITGHATVHYLDCYWDAEGDHSLEEIEDFAILDATDPEYAEWYGEGWNEQLASEVDVVEYPDGVYVSDEALYQRFCRQLYKTLQLKTEPEDLVGGPTITAKLLIRAASSDNAIWYHGSNSSDEFEALRKNKDGIIWLADRDAANRYAHTHYKDGHPRLFEVRLKAGARIIDLRDLSNPAVREFKDKVNEIRKYGFGPISDEAWPRWADFGMLERYEWAVKWFRSKRVDGLLLKDAAGAFDHESLALINPKAIESQQIVPVDAKPLHKAKLLTKAAKPLTETPAFKRWFAGSKIVDAQGQPLMMYHGTRDHFDKVDMSQGAQGVFWLTSNRDSLVAGERGASSSRTVLRCYVKITNPAGWDEYERKSLGELKRDYDGVVLPDGDGSFDAIVFKPNQVKILPPEETRVTAKLLKRRASGVPAKRVVEYVNSLRGFINENTEKQILEFPTWKIERIPLTGLDIGGSPQDPELADEYARRKSAYPPIVVDSEGWVIDGQHRTQAARDRGDTSIMAYIPEAFGAHKQAVKYRTYTPPDPQTETPQFKAWFKNSKVVDLDSRPLIVHHGTPDMRFLKENGTFKSWKERHNGDEAGGDEDAFWFAADRATATSYADDHRAWDYQNAEPGVFSAYLSIQNPLVLDNKGERWKGSTRVSIEEAKKKGHDGIIIMNTIDDYNVKGRKSTTTYAVFNSSQIKAVQGNDGGFGTGSKNVYASVDKEAADQLDYKPILTELMQVLKPGLPVPKVEIVNRKADWLGLDRWQYGRNANGVSWSDDNTTVYLQKVIMSEEQTIRRILAHELCHHEDNLARLRPEFQRLGFHTFQMMYKGRDGHGAEWKAIAARFNAKYGPDFVTRTSDETYALDQSDVKPYFAFLYRQHSGKIQWTHANILSPNMRKYLARKFSENQEVVSAGQPPIYRLFKVTDRFYMQKSPTIASGSIGYSNTPAENEKLEKLWNEGEDVLSQFSSSEDPDQGPYFVLMGQYLRGKLAWQHAKTLTPKMKEYLGRISQGMNKLFQTDDPFFLDSRKIGPNVTPTFARDAEQQAKAEKLWNEGQDLLPQYASKPRVTAKLLKRRAVSNDYATRTYYRGSVPGRTDRIRTGENAWDACLFVADSPKQASNYGSHIDEYRFKPGARILVEGTRDFQRMRGSTKGENMLQTCSRIVEKAKQLGYDAVYFTLQGTIGTAVINRDAIEKTGVYQGLDAKSPLTASRTVAHNMTYNVVCGRCGGAGRYDRGICFGCKGLGTARTTRKPTPPEQRLTVTYENGSQMYPFTRPPSNKRSLLWNDRSN